MTTNYADLLNTLEDIRKKSKERTAKYIELNLLEAEINALHDKVAAYRVRIRAEEFHNDITAGG